MGIEKIVSGLSDVASGFVKKSKKIQIPQDVLSKKVPLDSKKIEASLDCLAASSKAIMLNKGIAAKFVDIPSPKITSALQETPLKKAVISKMPTAKSLAKEGVLSGLNAKEAVNGAKATMSAISKPVGFSAAESAKTFIDNGPNKLERKLDLQQKYGEKLSQVKAKNAAAAETAKQLEELAKVDKLLG